MVSTNEHDCVPDALMVVPVGYADWLTNVKRRFDRATQEFTLKGVKREKPSLATLLTAPLLRTEHPCPDRACGGMRSV